jgi:hypothetical protein
MGLESLKGNIIASKSRGTIKPVYFKKGSGRRGTMMLAIMAPIGFSSYCTLKLLFSRVTVLPQV